MTLGEAIERIDVLKPNAYTVVDKVGWLSTIEGMIKRTVIDSHEDGEDIEFNGYDESTPLSTELLVGDPYTDIYVLWLESKIDYTNAEYIKYNNSITRFNDTFQLFSNEYNRQHMPKGNKIRYY